MYQAYSYPISILFPKYLAVPLYLSVTPSFASGVYCERTDEKLGKKQEHIYGDYIQVLNPKVICMLMKCLDQYLSPYKYEFNPS